jgi:DNA-binding beta-propeller fold protein YncE
VSRPGFADGSAPVYPSHLGTIPFEGSTSGDIVFNPNNRKLYVTNQTANLLVLDPDRSAVERTTLLPFEGSR